MIALKLRLLSASLALALLLVAGAGCPPASTGEGEGEGEGEGGEGEGEGCATDPLLGSLTVANGYLLVGGQGIPDTIVSIGINDAGATPEILGLTSDLHVVDLGTFPGTTPALPPVLFDMLAPADSTLARGTEAFASFILVDGNFVAAGYTRASDFGGNISTFDVTAGGNATYTDAPSNFAAARVDGTLFVESSGLDGTGTALGVYDEAAAGSASLLASLGANVIANSNIAATSSGDALVFGRFANGSNQLYAFPKTRIDAVIAGTDSAIDLDAETSIFDGTLNGFASGVSSFGAGIAQIDVDNASFKGIAVRHTSVTVNGTAVATSVPDDVLTGGASTCTTVEFLANLGDDLLVGVKDAAGLRVIQNPRAVSADGTLVI